MSDPLNICFVLGAGFSCAYSENAPGMPEFLDFALARAYYRPSGEHKILRDIATKYFNSPTKMNVEDLASFLALDLPGDAQTACELHSVAYDQLLDVIVDTLAGANTPRDTRTESTFRRFAEYVVDKQIPIITFNYDLILDQLLRGYDEVDTLGWLRGRFSAQPAEGNRGGNNSHREDTIGRHFTCAPPQTTWIFELGNSLCSIGVRPRC